MREQIKDENYELEQRKTIKGYPELHWTGKRPYRSTQYFPAQLKEIYGKEKDGWMNKLFWGDNLQVMSHMLREFRGKIDLIYIDPPFDSKADYKRKIKLKGIKVTNDTNVFEEKQYTDIWSNDEYLQFMYERLILLRELLSDTGSIYLHCDYRKVHHLRCLMDEVFGPQNIQNEIVWGYTSPSRVNNRFPNKHDTILAYNKTKKYYFNPESVRVAYDEATLERRKHSETKKDGISFKGKKFEEYLKGKVPPDWWNDLGNSINYEKISKLNKDEIIEVFRKIYNKNEILVDIWDDVPSGGQISRYELIGYPTQKSEKLLERIIKASSKKNDIIFDCFMGSGTTQAVAMKLGRRFIGADINLGSVRLTTNRLIRMQNELKNYNNIYSGFEVHNVNNYDFFRNPEEAKELIIEALEIKSVENGNIYDGEKDGRMVKIMPINRIATKADLEELKANFPYKTFEKRKHENPNKPVEKLLLVCMGHVPDLKVSLEQELSDYNLDIKIVDILRDKSVIELKRDSEIELTVHNKKIMILNFYPMNLLQKLSLQKEYIEDWKQLVESVMIDFNYDGAVIQPSIIDIPNNDELVKGEYDIPDDAGTIRIKVTDLLSESLEWEVEK